MVIYCRLFTPYSIAGPTTEHKGAMGICPQFILPLQSYTNKVGFRLQLTTYHVSLSPSDLKMSRQACVVCTAL